MSFLPVSGWAACDQAGLAGTWSVEVWGGSSGGVNCWNLCTLTVGADGAIASGGTYTDCYGVESDVKSDVTGGQLTVYPGFRIEGTIVTSSATIHVGPGGIIGDKLVLGTE